MISWRNFFKQILISFMACKWNSWRANTPSTVEKKLPVFLEFLSSVRDLCDRKKDANKNLFVRFAEISFYTKAQFLNKKPATQIFTLLCI